MSKDNNATNEKLKKVNKLYKANLMKNPCEKKLLTTS